MIFFIFKGIPLIHSGGCAKGYFHAFRVGVKGRRVPRVSLLEPGSKSTPPQVVSRYNLFMNRSAAEVLEDARRLPPGDFD